MKEIRSCPGLAEASILYVREVVRRKHEVTRAEAAGLLRLKTVAVHKREEVYERVPSIYTEAIIFPRPINTCSANEGFWCSNIIKPRKRLSPVSG